MLKIKEFLTGAEVVAQAAQATGATHFFGYPITPGTEILTLWSAAAEKNKNLTFLQTEDEIAAGFAAVGSIMAGRIAFSATAGPGTILMQDPLVMAEAMRLPLVLVIIQRGGPSSGTVIYSQQEVTLAIYGGNNEGRRVVYSPSSLTELYQQVGQAFSTAWQYRFPAIVLTDGYLMKSRGIVEVPEKLPTVSNQPIMLLGANSHLPNIFTFEKELFDKNQADAADFEKMSLAVAAFENYQTADAEEIIIAHGIVAAAGRQAVSLLREQGRLVGLFRPVTLNPFSREAINQLAKKIKRFIVIESSLGQLERLVKSNLEMPVKIAHYLRPALGIEVEEIVDFISK